MIFAQSPDAEDDRTLAAQLTLNRDFDLSQPQEVVKAFLYTARSGDYPYLRALCNPFVADYANIAEGRLNEICYWLPVYGGVDSSLDDLKAEFAAMGDFRLADQTPEIIEEGRDKWARVRLVGASGEAVVVLKQVGMWWFLQRWEE